MESLKRFLRGPDSSFFLFGPRGTGKSTWLREARQGAIWVDLLDPEAQRIYQARPERLRELVAGRPETVDVVIDEVQKVIRDVEFVDIPFLRMGAMLAPYWDNRQ